MSEVVRLRTRAEIEEEAAAWIWRMEDAPRDEDREAFEAWLRQDARNRRAFEEFTKVWNGLDGLPAAQPAPAPLNADVTDPATKGVLLAGRRCWWVSAAAALVAAVGAAAWLYEGSETQTLTTTIGQHRHVTLSDGTQVALNTDTVLETRFNRHTREMFLRKGEAHFEVAPQRTRPFLVHAGDAVVQAIGTEFEVRVHPDRHVDVLVNEGRVEVRPDIPSTRQWPAGGSGDATASLPAVTVRALSANQQLSTSTTSYAVVPVSPEKVSSELAWRDGAVIFDSAPLAQAITEIQRYTDARIIISDPQVSALPVGGRFKTDDLQGFLDGLEAALPIAIRRSSNGAIYIDPRQ